MAKEKKRIGIPFGGADWFSCHNPDSTTSQGGQKPKRRCLSSTERLNLAWRLAPHSCWGKPYWLLKNKEKGQEVPKLPERPPTSYQDLSQRAAPGDSWIWGPKDGEVLYKVVLYKTRWQCLQRAALVGPWNAVGEDLTLFLFKAISWVLE